MCHHFIEYPMKASKSRTATKAQRLECVRIERGMPAALEACRHLGWGLNPGVLLWRAWHSWITWFGLVGAVLLWALEMYVNAMQL